MMPDRIRAIHECVTWGKIYGVFFHFPIWCLGSGVEPFIASIPDLCLLYLNAFDWYQMFALDSFVIKAQNVFDSHGGLLTFAMIII